MGGLLGDQVEKLSLGELELLILSASLHDLGMVYDDEEIDRYYKDELECRAFLEECAPDLLGCPANEWPEDTRKWFLRKLHPFRIPEILQKQFWRELFDERPLDAIPERCIIAVCQAHGENGATLKFNHNLEYLDASLADPLFCALLLRLSDLLDFDDTRAPRTLYGYVLKNDTSRKEWDKHRASAGFTYHITPSTDLLPYKANCCNPGIEHAVQEFLDWIDEELDNCAEMKKCCRLDWQRDFPFPRAISRKEIESNGYMSGDFKMTMDQEQILKVLSGDSLYDNNTVFVRELLQNAIDATLLRDKIDPNFSIENARIDFWEWTDAEGNTWFRIDDQGTGMTLGMLQRYFLKVGNSYYNSKELTRDLRVHGQESDYHAISRFGVGFLSCFLCAEYVEISTLYFDAEKNRRELGVFETYPVIRHGLRLQITGLSGYYTLKCQAQRHLADTFLPAPPQLDALIDVLKETEISGYRSKPGTSIAVRLNPGKIGAVDLRKEVEKYLCLSTLKVYYNGERVGRTYHEFMKDIHSLAGKKEYGLSEIEKEKFDAVFPFLAGQYPKILMSVLPLDTQEYRILQGLSGVLIKYDLKFGVKPEWRVKDQSYRLEHAFYCDNDSVHVTIYPENSKTNGGNWSELERKYSFQDLSELVSVFEKFSACPSVDQIKAAWLPFEAEEDLHDMWISWINHSQMSMYIDLKQSGVPLLNGLSRNNNCHKVVYTYNGVFHGSFGDSRYRYKGDALLLFEHDLRPETPISRNNVVAMPLKETVTEAALMYSFGYDDDDHFTSIRGWNDAPLKKWHQLRTEEMGAWAERILGGFFKEKMDLLRQGTTLEGKEYSFSISSNRNFANSERVMEKYLCSVLQDTYNMTIFYDNTHIQAISFIEKEMSVEDNQYDLFPPMMFCKAANHKSRQYLCCADHNFRHAITADHPYAVWLVRHAIVLSQHFPRHFRQIVSCLRDKHSDAIIKECNSIREQLILLAQRQRKNLGDIPQLCENDFWYTDWMIEDMNAVNGV